MTRALRIMLVANDGLSAGHVTRTLGVARALARRGAARGVAVQLLLATTSEADALLASEPIAIVRMPAPAAARRAGLSDAERRRVVRGCVESLVSTFAPDAIVADTFPSGPHGELAGIADGHAKRVLVRRHVPRARARDEALSAGLSSYDLAILAADPTPLDASLPIRCVHVPPITHVDPGDRRSRAEAREELGLPAEGRVLLVTAGGGGDPEAAARAARIARTAARLDPNATLAVTAGPLTQEAPGAAGSTLRGPTLRGSTVPGSGEERPLVAVSRAPLSPWMGAFDGAFAAAGYNTAHELATAGVPTALFASPRPFDDQEARARRFEQAGLAQTLTRDDDDAIAAALNWLARAPRPSIATGGADAAANAIFDLLTASAGPA